MSDVSINYRGSAIATMDASGTKTLLTEGKYCEDDIDVVYVKPSASGPKWELIGQSTHALTEYTDTSTVETTNTNINVQNTDYAYVLVVVTCDSEITTSSEWGMSIFLLGRYASNTGLISYPSGTNAGTWEKGTATLSMAALTNQMQLSGNSVGLTIKNAVGTIQIQRKANASACPKLRAGNYTVKAYGLASL